MARKFKNTERRIIAISVMHFIDWELPEAPAEVVIQTEPTDASQRVRSIKPTLLEVRKPILCDLTAPLTETEPILPTVVAETRKPVLGRWGECVPTASPCETSPSEPVFATQPIVSAEPPYATEPTFAAEPVFATQPTLPTEPELAPEPVMDHTVAIPRQVPNQPAFSCQSIFPAQSTVAIQQEMPSDPTMSTQPTLPSEHELQIQSMLGDLEQRRAMQRPGVLKTGEVAKLRGAAMETLKNQVISQSSGGMSESSMRGAFKRIEQQRKFGGRRPQNG